MKTVLSQDVYDLFNQWYIKHANLDDCPSLAAEEISRATLARDAWIASWSSSHKTVDDHTKDVLGYPEEWL